MSGVKLSAHAVPPPPVVPYIRQDGTDAFQGYVEQSIYYVPRTGGAAGANAVRATFPTSGNTDTMPEVSPEGRRIAFSRNFAGIRVVDIDAATDTSVVNFDEGSTFGINSRHRWSPDGTMIAWMEAEQFPSRTRLYVAMAPPAAPSVVMLKETVSLGDFGWLPDGSKVVYCSGGLIRTVNPDGTGDASLGVTVPSSSRNRLHVGKVSGVLVWQDFTGVTGGTLKKCNPDGTGVTTVHTFGANRHRTSNHALAEDESGWVYVYDANNTNNVDGYWTSSIGKDSEVRFIPLDASGEVPLGRWPFTEYEGGNIGNNPCDTPHAYGDRIYCMFNNVNDGGDYPSGNVSHYVWGSFLFDGSGSRVEDEFDISGPGTPASWDTATMRITMEAPIGG